MKGAISYCKLCSLQQYKNKDRSIFQMKGNKNTASIKV